MLWRMAGSLPMLPAASWAHKLLPLASLCARLSAPLHGVIAHYVFDRALQAPLARLFAAHVDITSRQVAAHSTNLAERGLLPLMQWTFSSGCACHDVHNSLKWSLHAISRTRS
jgi:hypothetical protein